MAGLIPFRVFNADHEEIESWLLAINAQLTLLELEEDAKKIAYCHAHLGPAHSEVAEAVADIQVWKEYQDKIREELTTRPSKKKARKALNVMKYEGSLRKMWRQANKLALLAFPHLSKAHQEEEAREAFIRGCPAEVRKYCSIHEPPRGKYIVELAQRILDAQEEADDGVYEIARRREETDTPIRRTGVPSQITTNPRSGNSQIRCYNCGGRGHTPRECPSAPTRQPGRNETDRHQGQASMTEGEQHRETDFFPPPPADRELLMGTVYDRADSPPLVAVKFNGCSLQLLIDTGASRTCISEKTYNKYQKYMGPLHPTEFHLKGAFGCPLSVLGQTAPISMEWPQQQVWASCVVLKGDVGHDRNGYLGMDVLRMTGSWVDCESGTIHPKQEIASYSATLKDNVSLPPRSWAYAPRDLGVHPKRLTTHLGKRDHSYPCIQTCCNISETWTRNPKNEERRSPGICRRGRNKPTRFSPTYYKFSSRNSRESLPNPTRTANTSAQQIGLQRHLISGQTQSPPSGSYHQVNNETQSFHSCDNEIYTSPGGVQRTRCGRPVVAPVRYQSLGTVSEDTNSGTHRFPLLDELEGNNDETHSFHLHDDEIYTPPGGVQRTRCGRPVVAPVRYQSPGTVSEDTNSGTHRFPLFDGLEGNNDETHCFHLQDNETSAPPRRAQTTRCGRPVVLPARYRSPGESDEDIDDGTYSVPRYDKEFREHNDGTHRFPSDDRETSPISVGVCGASEGCHSPASPQASLSTFPLKKLVMVHQNRARRLTSVRDVEQWLSSPAPGLIIRLRQAITGSGSLKLRDVLLPVLDRFDLYKDKFGYSGVAREKKDARRQCSPPSTSVDQRLSHDKLLPRERAVYPPTTFNPVRLTHVTRIPSRLSDHGNPLPRENSRVNTQVARPSDPRPAPRWTATPTCSRKKSQSGCESWKPDPRRCRPITYPQQERRPDPTLFQGSTCSTPGSRRSGARLVKEGGSVIPARPAVSRGGPVTPLPSPPHPTPSPRQVTTYLPVDI